MFAAAFGCAALSVWICAGPVAASPATIEGVWSFSDGSVIIAPDAAGQLVGTVTSPTLFDACVHPVGQEIWSDMEPTGDGGYDGMHVWYRGSGSDCQIYELGPTAFRVVATGNGGDILRVCFNRPGTTAPTIAPDGTPSGVNYRCIDSAPVGAVPSTPPSFGQTIELPATSKGVCLSLRNFIIHVREPRHDPFVRMTITLGHDRLTVRKHGDEITADIDLRGLPRGTYTVHIRARTAAGFIVKGSRTYHTCVPKRLS